MSDKIDFSVSFTGKNKSHIKDQREKLAGAVFAKLEQNVEYVISYNVTSTYDPINKITVTRIGMTAKPVPLDNVKLPQQVGAISGVELNGLVTNPPKDGEVKIDINPATAST